MFSNTRFAAVALALVISGLAGTAHAYDGFGGGDRETVIRQSALSPMATGMTKADDRFTVGSNAWTGDRDALITTSASAGFGKRMVATNAR
ncbi:MAG TPA: hypothetical protein VF930_02270 [Stellaceae bacterium]